MSIEAMKQALEALEKQHNWMVANGGTFAESSKKAIFALEKAIEQAEKQEPVAWAKFNQGEITHSEMTDGSGCDFELRAAGFVPLYTAPVHASDISAERVDETAKDRPDCNTCENRGVLIPLAQETYCENCIYGSPWKANYYKEKNT
jgi:hypothetical protein